MKGSGLKPLDEGKTSEETTHVFGKNLEDRVVKQDDAEQESNPFKGLAERQDDDIDSIKKRKFDAITGEEDEDTVFQGDFKLFVWDLTTSNWVEKGRGQLKLNDSSELGAKKSRLIMRISGTLRILLNIAIKHSFFRVIASSKTSIRFTDSQTVWAASGTNANHLKELLDERIAIAAEQEPTEEGLAEKRVKADVVESTPPNKTPVEEKSDQSSASANSDQEDRLKGDELREDEESKKNDESVEGKQKNEESGDDSSELTSESDRDDEQESSHKSNTSIEQPIKEVPQEDETHDSTHTSADEEQPEADN